MVIAPQSPLMNTPLTSEVAESRDPAKTRWTVCEPEVHIRELEARLLETERQNSELREQLESLKRDPSHCSQDEETTRQFMAAIDQSSESIFFTDVKGRILYVNESFVKNSGYTREELIGQTPRILKSGWHPASFYKDMWATLLRGDIFRGHMVNKRKDGTLYHEEANISPVRNIEGKITSFVSVKTDITRYLETQSALESSNQDLMRSNAELEQFAYVASHDLQEPLRSVSSCMQLLKKRYAGQLDERADEFIAHAVVGCQRMRELIDALLTLSRVGSGAEPMMDTDCAAVFERVRDNLSQAIEESEAQVSHEGLPTLQASPQMLARLFQNLIGNALKFRGTRPAVVHVSAKRMSDEWVFSVEDHGIGIDPQHFDRIFRLFQRLHPRDDYAGTGLGLAICQKIVERHGGRIWVKSQPGHGTTFFFTIPLRSL